MRWSTWANAGASGRGAKGELSFTDIVAAGCAAVWVVGFINRFVFHGDSLVDSGVNGLIRAFDFLLISGVVKIGRTLSQLNSAYVLGGGCASAWLLGFMKFFVFERLSFSTSSIGGLHFAFEFLVLAGVVVLLRKFGRLGIHCFNKLFEVISRALTGKTRGRR